MNGMQMQPAPHDVAGWLVVIAGSLATLWAFVAAVYWTVRPGETNPDHPKRIVLRNDR